MKSCSILLVALGLASSTVLAQSTQSPDQSSSGGTSESAAPNSDAGGMERLPAPAMGSQSQESSGSENGGMDSSGASGAQDSAAGSSGQLITPEIAQSRPAAETTGIAAKSHTENGITYMCGGVGKDEASYMKDAAAKDYDLMMTFAENSGAYVANVNVSIKDARGRTVLNTKCDAPILLVDLPSGGNYRIHADAAGRAFDRTASVKNTKGHAQQVRFVWPAGTFASSGSRHSSGHESTGSQSYEPENSGSDMRDEDSGKNMR